MRGKRNLLAVLLLSASVALLGFIIDADEYVPDIVQNTIDFMIVTTLVFVTITTMYVTVSQVKK